MTRLFAATCLLVLSTCVPALAGTVYVAQIAPTSQILTFDTATPASRTVINAAFAWEGGFVSGLDFNAAGSVLYATTSNGRFGTIDTSTGTFNLIASLSGLAAGNNATGLSIDPNSGTFYVSSTNSVQSALYTLNPSTGALTLIGSPQTTAPGVLAIAISSAGVIYANDAANDNLYTLDPTTGAATLVGPLGFDVNFAQGMDFDYGSGTLYAALMTLGGQSYWASINTSTGAATSLLDLGGLEWEVAIRNGATVPEPAAYLLLAGGLLGLGILRRRR